jgi:hypothetical protein
VGRSNYGISFPVTDLGSILNVSWALTNGPSADDLTSAIPTTGIANLALFLAAQLLIQATTSGFIFGEMSSSLKIATIRLSINLDFYIKPAVLNTVIRNGKFHFNGFLYGGH